MKITKITIHYGRTINLGNYENIRLECELEAELGPLDHADDEAPDLWMKARQQVMMEYMAFKDRTRKIEESAKVVEAAHRAIRRLPADAPANIAAATGPAPDWTEDGPRIQSNGWPEGYGKDGADLTDPKFGG